MTFPWNIARGLGQAFAALETSLATADHFTNLLSRLGWQVQLSPQQMTVISSVLGLNGALRDLVDALDNDESSAETVVEAALVIIRALYDLGQVNLSDIAALPEPLNDEAFWREDFPSPLIDLLLTDLIKDKVAGLHGFMNVFGLLEPRSIEGTVWWLTAPSKLRWDRLLPSLTDPVGHLKDIYGWDGDLQLSAIADAISGFVQRLGLESQQVPISDIARGRFYPDYGNEIVIRATEVVFINTGLTRAGLRIFPVANGRDNGLYIEPFLIGSPDATVSRPSGIDFVMEANAEISGYGLFLQPDGQETLGTAASLDQEMRLIWQPETPQVLIGQPDGVRLELIDGEISLAFKGSPSDPEVIIAVGGHDTGLQLVLTPEDSDAFINELLNNVSLNTNLALRFVWSSKSGFAIEGSAGLEIIVPLNVELQFVTLSELYAALTIGTDAVEIIGALTFSALLPPLTFTVKRIGLITQITPKDNPDGDVLGGLDVALAFKPPTGVGIALNFLDIVYGGGFIDFYPEKGEYSGIIHVQLAVIGVTATAIITTRLPDKPDGWSMFVSINVNLGGIPLGFGFTLEKVGGLIGIHRSIDQDVFQAGVRTGLLDSILFPDDPIGDAPRILSDIQNAFPIAQGSFVVGAMLQIGWGVPTIITADVGFIIQVPDIILMLIGQAETILPVEEAPLIEIHFDVLGIIDLTEGTLSIDAGLRDSRIIGYVLTGQMALRANFLNQPSFLLAMGGFHPAFVPPDSFPTLARMGLGLSVGDWLNISLEAYLALTSNTVQFGAGLYLTAQLVGFRIEGGVEINTLITFSPFQFRADISFYISVSAGSIELLGVLLTGHLSGPNPFYVRAQAHFKLLMIEHDVNIEESIGGKTALDDIDDIPLLDDVAAAFLESENWRAIDDGNRIGAVLLAEVTDPDAEPQIHPGGSVEVIQRVAPLDVELERYGSAEIEGEEDFEITNVKAGTEDIAWEFVEDWFAPAQFFDIEKDEKLDAPSFEMMKAGLRFGDDEADDGTAADTVYNYEQIVHDPEFNVPRLKLLVFNPQDTLLTSVNLQKNSMSSRSLVRRSSANTYTLNPVRYTVVDHQTLKSGAGMPSRTMTHAEAAQKSTFNDNRIVVTASERLGE